MCDPTLRVSCETQHLCAGTEAGTLEAVEKE